MLYFQLEDNTSFLLKIFQVVSLVFCLENLLHVTLVAYISLPYFSFNLRKADILLPKSVTSFCVQQQQYASVWQQAEGGLCFR